MYSRKSWGGAVDPYIDVKILKPDNLADNQDPIVSLVIFEWQDRPLVGKQSDPDDPYKVRVQERGTKWRGKRRRNNSSSSIQQLAELPKM
jgi:hypothetical protein